MSREDGNRKLTCDPRNSANASFPTRSTRVRGRCWVRSVEPIKAKGYDSRNSNPGQDRPKEEPTPFSARRLSSHAGEQVKTSPLLFQQLKGRPRFILHSLEHAGKGRSRPPRNRTKLSS